MGESLDIVSYIDYLNDKPIFSASPTNNSALTTWISESNTLLNHLLFPRWVKIYPALAEFTILSSRDYFTNKKQQVIGDFYQDFENSQQYKLALETALIQLAELMYSSQRVNKQLSLDDIDLFSRLSGLTLIKDLIIANKVRAYIDYFAAK